MSEIIDPPVAADSIQRLKPNAVGLIGVLFMAVATAAPITARTRPPTSEPVPTDALVKG